jgi:UDP-N-acetyl-D-glucosamine dehydrogenase
MKKLLLSKFKNKKFIVGIVGLGYVGLPICERFSRVGVEVIGVDNNSSKINTLKKGSSYIKSSKLKNFNYFNKNKKNLSTNYKILTKCDAILICLPTPLKNYRPDMSYVFNCAKKLKKIIKPYQLLVLESTVYPGATNDLVNIIKQKKLNIGSNFFVGYSPERENPGDKSFSYKKTPKVISGFSKYCLILMDALYKHITFKRVKSEDLKSAELSKLLENLYRSVNIGLINELKIICEYLKIDIFKVIDLASTKNFGFQKFLPGPGLGGHCIPIDPYYLSWISKKKGYNPKFIPLAGKINTMMPLWVVNKMLSNLKSPKQKILILGVAYKKNVDDDRESPSFEIMKILQKKKINFEYNDPYFDKIRKGRQNKIIKKSIILNKNNLKKFSAVLVVTDHDKYDYKFIAQNSKIVFDARGVYKKFAFKNIVYC